MSWSYEQTVKALQVALSGAAGLLTDADTRRAAAQLEEELIDPFLAAHPDWSDASNWQVTFRKQAAASCRVLLRREVLDLEGWSDEDLAAAMADAGLGKPGRARSLLWRLGEVLDRDGEDRALYDLFQGLDPQRSLEHVLVRGIRVNLELRARQRPALREVLGALSRQRLERRLEGVEDQLRSAVAGQKLDGLSALGGERRRLRRWVLQLDARERALSVREEALGVELVSQWEAALEAVGGVREEVRKVGGRVGAVHSEVQVLVQELRALRRELRLKDQVQSTDSGSVSSEGAESRVRGVLSRVATLPSDSREHPSLSASVGQLLLAVGEAAQAAARFEHAARAANDVEEEATQTYNAFRARLCAKDLDAARRHYLRAVELAPHRFRLYDPERYPTLVRVLGAGGFGVAFLCANRRGAPRVVKALFGEEGSITRRARREVALLKRVQSVCVAKVYGRGWAYPEEGRGSFLVLEYAGEETLGQWVGRRGSMPLEVAGPVLRGIAEGLRAAHAAGVLHRDVKPANVLLQPAEEGWAPKVIDFGLAVDPSTLQRHSGSNGSEAGRSGAGVAGTLRYAPPEQTGQRNESVSPASDVYGFGKTALYLLFGETSLHRRQRRQLPKALFELLEDCVEEDPRRRPQDFEAVLERLEWGQEGGEPGEVAGFERLEGSPARYRHVETGLLFRWIPEGRFVMGAGDGQGEPDERPQREVRVEAFLLCETPCPQRVWDQVRVSRGLETRDERKWEGAELPIEGVNWEEARAWCEAVGLRLPSEAEREFAGRAGSRGRYCFGDDRRRLDEYAWFKENSGLRTRPVGGKRANAWGLYDVHGNVWEWCADDWHESYDGAPAEGEPWVTGEFGRVLRGGGWYSSATFCRLTFRDHFVPQTRSDDVGFRPAADVSGGW